MCRFTRPSKAPKIMNYKLNTKDASESKESIWTGLARLLPLMADEWRNIGIAFSAIALTSAMALTAPFIIGHIVDQFIATGDYAGVLTWSGLLLAVFLVQLASSYTQTRTMGGVG